MGDIDRLTFVDSIQSVSLMDKAKYSPSRASRLVKSLGYFGVIFLDERKTELLGTNLRAPREWPGNKTREIVGAKHHYLLVE